MKTEPTLPPEIHERARKKALTLIPVEWTSLANVRIRTLPPSIMAEVITSLRQDGLVEVRKVKGGIEIRRVKTDAGETVKS